MPALSTQRVMNTERVSGVHIDNVLAPAMPQEADLWGRPGMAL